MRKIEEIQQYISSACVDPLLDEDDEFSLCLLEGFAIKSIGGIEAVALAFEYGRAKGYLAAKAEVVR